MFTFHSPHTVKRLEPNGVVREVRVTIPAEFPPALLAEGLLYTFERYVWRTRDGAPAGYYQADDGSELWYCDGRAWGR